MTSRSSSALTTACSIWIPQQTKAITKKEQRGQQPIKIGQEEKKTSRKRPYKSAVCCNFPNQVAHQRGHFLSPLKSMGFKEYSVAQDRTFQHFIQLLDQEATRVIKRCLFKYDYHSTIYNVFVLLKLLVFFHLELPKYCSYSTVPHYRCTLLLSCLNARPSKVLQGRCLTITYADNVCDYRQVVQTPSIT